MATCLLSAFAPLSFFIWLFAVKPLQTKGYRIGVTIAGFLTSGIVFLLAGLTLPTLFSTLAAIGWLLYSYWYAKMKHDLSPERLWQVSDWRFRDERDQLFNPFDHVARYRIFVFLRGPWCPFCVAQIKDLTGAYNGLSKRGVQLNFISSDHKLQESALAQQFGIKVNMLRDHNFEVIQRIGILHKNALPVGMELLGFKSHHAQPAVIITDGSGKVLFSEVFEDSRERKSSDFFIEIIDKMEANWRETLI